MRLLLIALLFPLAVQAQTVEQMCAMAWDISLVTRTLAKHGITRDQIRPMLADIYNTPDHESRRLMERLTDLAYQHQTEPRPFAAAIRTACLHGQLGKLLGIEG